MTTAATADLAACLMRIERDVASIGATGFASGGSCVRLVRTHGDTLQRALALLAAVESGEWRCVPVEATEAMLRAGVEGVYGPATYKCVNRSGTELYEQEADSNYSAMLAAAPPPPIESVSQWRPIETAPKDGTRVLIKFASGSEREATWRTTYGGEWHVKSFTHLPWHDQHEIASWMPLPAAPAAPGVEG